MSSDKYRVKRAIIMAAGKGNRLRPLTYTIPKPLIEVNGVRMIDTIIDGLLLNGITDIYIVTGYLASSFEVLLLKYPGINIVNNPFYENSNNISSLYAARDLLDTDIMIMDADLLIRNEDILNPVFPISGYNASMVTEHTDEWVMTVDKGLVTSCSRCGGDEGWQLYSVSRWCRDDAVKLKEYTVTEFEINKRHDIYWDDIPMFLYADRFDLGVNAIDKADVLEIDSLEELKRIDPSYLFVKGE